MNKEQEKEYIDIVGRILKGERAIEPREENYPYFVRMVREGKFLNGKFTPSGKDCRVLQVTEEGEIRYNDLKDKKRPLFRIYKKIFNLPYLGILTLLISTLTLYFRFPSETAKLIKTILIFLKQTILGN